MHQKNIDYTLFFLVFGLVIFGMIMISSVSVYPSYNVTSRMMELGRIDAPNNWFYLVRNISHVFIASLAFVFFVKFPTEAIERNARAIFVSGMVFLALVLFIGAEYNGARGWISIPYLPFSLQPVEFMKLAIIIYLASYLKRNRALMRSFQQ
ncbi:MAG TPA: FtsW/RodA/SpoVE family cell cycle protein [bacterium]|nr:FtsW/RodA/SpoVE family cell cycle protein [bacterium]